MRDIFVIFLLLPAHASKRACRGQRERHVRLSTRHAGPEDNATIQNLCAYHNAERDGRTSGNVESYREGRGARLTVWAPKGKEPRPNTNKCKPQKTHSHEAGSRHTHTCQPRRPPNRQPRTTSYHLGRGAREAAQWGRPDTLVRLYKPDQPKVALPRNRATPSISKYAPDRHRDALPQHRATLRDCPRLLAGRSPWLTFVGVSRACLVEVCLVWLRFVCVWTELFAFQRPCCPTCPASLSV
jgi:hypothetical protein